MKKLVLLTLACVLCLAGCKRSEIFSLDEIDALFSEQGYTQEQFKEALSGRSREDIVAAWGEPSGSLSGFCGDIWSVNGERIAVVYYDEDLHVTDAIIGTPER